MNSSKNRVVQRLLALLILLAACGGPATATIPAEKTPTPPLKPSAAPTAIGRLDIVVHYPTADTIVEMGWSPRLTVQVEREAEYYERQSQIVSTLIRVLGFLVAFVMAIGAVFGALNTMYSAVAARAREIATMRALGFGGGSVIMSFMLESLLIALVGGVLGCIAVLPLNGFTAGTMNWQTFSHLAFAFRVTPGLLAAGIVFALFMGFVGGVLPAIRAARLQVAHALREW